MRKMIHYITDRVVTKKGMWITIATWLIGIALLTTIAPDSSDYEVSSLDTLPEHMESVIADEKINQYFGESDGIPGIFVFEATENPLDTDDVTSFLQMIENEEVDGIKEMLPLEMLPDPVMQTFFAEDETAAFIPLTFEDMDTKEVKASIRKIQSLADNQSTFRFYVTGPAGIAVDTSDLFSRADLVLLFSTVGIILILLIVTYRSPLLALIPLLAAGFIYFVSDQILGFIGNSGVKLASQSLSIMMILLFALVIDYSLFIFSRFREELKKEENKYIAMRQAMKEIGTPIFYSGATVFGAMLILLFAQFGDYRNFAPIFGTAIFVVMISAVTLIPALFTIFGRNAFWPKIPRVGDKHIKKGSFWRKVATFVTTKPIISTTIIGTFLLLSASNVFSTTYEFNMMKSFPDDMPSRQGYEILENKFSKGNLAPTTVLFESGEKISKEQQENIADELQSYPLVHDVQLNDITDDGKVVTYQLTFTEGPYDGITMDALEDMRDHAKQIITDSNASGELYFTGETASSIDNRTVNNRDLIVIVILETLLIFAMLIFLTKSWRMPVYMMGTILLSFIAALGLGMFLGKIFFNIESISNRIPVYSFVFLVALGIDYNIFLISRYMEERKHYPVKKAMELAVSNTGGVISSAGIVLAATFAVLMTQPVQDLFVFGFIVAVGILIDTFLIRGLLLPGIIVLFEKDPSNQVEAK